MRALPHHGDALPAHPCAKSTARGAPVNRGNVDEALKTASKVVEAEYEWPLQSHASMGPACAIADMNSAEPRMWSGSQKPHYVRSGTARICGIPVEKVRTTWVMGPGSYGRNDAGDAAVDAALLSKLTGRTVRLQYMRHDATAWDPKGPAGVFRGRAGLDAAGKVVAYNSTVKAFRGRTWCRSRPTPKTRSPGSSPAGNRKAT